MTGAIIILIIFQIIIPLLFVLWLGWRKSKSVFDLLIKLAASWSFVLYTYLISPWGIINYNLKYLLIIAVMIASVKAIVGVFRQPFFAKKKIWGWLKTIGQVCFAALYIALLLMTINGFSTDVEGIDLKFPLKSGLISHGGASVLTNYHNEHKGAQEYALDIIGINGWGQRANGFYPEDLKEYAIFGDTLYAPCNCKVVDIKDGIDNMPRGEMDKENITGNFIILEYKGSLMIFAHLLKNSILPGIGDILKTGQPMAQIGNSGNTSEPHLHMHAVKGIDPQGIMSGKGIPIYFDGDFLVRNDVVSSE